MGISLDQIADGQAVTNEVISGGTLMKRRNVTLRNCTFAGTSVIYAVADSNVLIEDCKALDISPGPNDFEGRLTISAWNEMPAAANCGVTVRRYEAAGGASDGIQVSGGAHGVTVEDSHFHDLIASGGVHTDGVQNVGANRLTVRRCLFERCDQACVSFDGSPSGEVFTDNVFFNCLTWFLGVGGDGTAVEHNTFWRESTYSGGWNVGFVLDKTHAGTASAAIVRYNAFGGTNRSVAAGTAAVDGPDLLNQSFNPDFTLKVPKLCADGTTYGARRGSPPVPSPYTERPPVGASVKVLRGPNKGKTATVTEGTQVRYSDNTLATFNLPGSLRPS